MELITQEQKAVLNELAWYMENCKFGENYFANGMLITIKSLLDLQEYLKEEFGVPYLLTHKVDQDYHEHFIGDMRSSDGRGGVRRPTALQLNYRISRYSSSELFYQAYFNMVGGAGCAIAHPLSWFLCI